MSLVNLRSEPAKACMKYVYMTQPASGSFTGSGDLVEGGRCTIGWKKVEKGFFRLEAKQDTNGTDYFYPWLQRGVGWVKVPKTAPESTIVMTGGVNGCTIVVTEQNNDYYFYHDGDSKNLKASMLVGNQVAKVQPKDYDPLDWGQKLFQQKLGELISGGGKPEGDISYGHFVVAVKSGGRFGFYKTGCMSVNGLTKLPIGVATCIVTWG